MTGPPLPSRLTPAVLAHALGPWVGGPGPTYRRLADALTAAVERGALAPGSGLPPERVLAAQLGLSRGTIVAALDLLHEAGTVARRQGSGTWITPDLGQRPDTEESSAGSRARGLTGRLFRPRGELIDLGISLLPDASDLPVDAFTVDPRRLDEWSEGHGYHPLGLPELRAAVAAMHTAEGLPTEPGQIVITNGAQHAIALTARVLVEPGDAVAVESPTYPGAIDAYARAGARFVTVASDTGGVRPDDLRRVLAAHEPRLVYLVPSAQNPTGTVLPDARRAELARLSGDTDTWLVEDETLRWAVFDRTTAIAPIASHRAAAKVLTVGSFSKVLWGGLRVGWLRGPEPLIERIGRWKAADDLGPSAVSQSIVIGLLDRLDQIAEHRRRSLDDGAARLAQLLADRLPEWTFRAPEGGLSLWVRLPRGTGDAFAQAALAHGVGVLPGSAACVDEACLDHIRLSFAIGPEPMAEAVERLARAWSDHRPTEGSSVRRPATALG